MAGYKNSTIKSNDSSRNNCNDSSCIIAYNPGGQSELQDIHKKLLDHFERKQLLENDEAVDYLQFLEAFKPANKQEVFYKNKFKKQIQTILKTYQAFLKFSGDSSGYRSSSTFASPSSPTGGDDSHNNPPADILTYLTDVNFITLDSCNDKNNDGGEEGSSDLFGSKNDVVISVNDKQIEAATNTNSVAVDARSHDYNKQIVLKNKDVFANDSPGRDVSQPEAQKQIVSDNSIQDLIAIRDDESLVNTTITISVTKPKLDLFEHIKPLREISETMSLYVSQFEPTMRDITEQFKQLALDTEEAKKHWEFAAGKRKLPDSPVDEHLWSKSDYRANEIAKVQARIRDDFRVIKFLEEAKRFKPNDWHLNNNNNNTVTNNNNN